MTTNRLTSANTNQPRVVAPAGLSEEERRQWWVARGNRVLWGQEPCKDGSFLTPRLDMEWGCDDSGSYYITTRRRARA